MAPIPPRHLAPKVVLYHQTHHTRVDDPAGDGGPPQEKPVSVLPLLGGGGGSGSGPEATGSLTSTSSPFITHLIVGAFHINDATIGDAPPQPNPHHLTLNDHPPDHPRFAVLWAEVAALQARGVRVLGMLGGAAKGTYARLDAEDAGEEDGGSGGSFEVAYGVLAAAVRRYRLDGLDLDVEEPMRLRGIVRLIDRLRADFGPAFLLTMAPVAAALLRPDDPRCNLSGFSYRALEAARGPAIAWYHAQFYCGWGDAARPDMYAAMTSVFAGGFLPPHRVVMGLVTNPANGPGFVPLDTTTEVVLQLQGEGGDGGGGQPGVGAGQGSAFGGVSGWEYFNALPGGAERPWEWAEWMAALLGPRVEADGQAGNLQTAPTPALAPAPATTIAEVDPDAPDGPEAPVPRAFDYSTETEEA